MRIFIFYAILCVLFSKINAYLLENIGTSLEITIAICHSLTSPNQSKEAG